MDWFDPNTAKLMEPKQTDGPGKKKRSRAGKTKPLAKQVAAAIAQPMDVWAAAFEHSLGQLNWPKKCDAESTFVWSTVIQEQAEVLVRAGLPAEPLARLLTDGSESTGQAITDQLSEMVGLVDQTTASLTDQWLKGADTDAYAALGVAAIAWSIPDLVRQPGTAWLNDWVQALADRTASFTADEEESAMCGLVLSCEMPLLLCLATSASKRTAMEEASRAMDNLAELLERGEERPAQWLACGATYLKACLASVLRCRILANALGLRKWFPPQQRALASMLKHASRWSRSDGSQMLGVSGLPPAHQRVWEALLDLTRKPKSLVAAMGSNQLLPGARTRFLKSISEDKLPEASFYSDDAANALMQAGWDHKGARVAIDFSDREICLEALGPGGVPLLVGEWKTRLVYEGFEQIQADEWCEVCWYSDEGVDYLELETRFGENARVQRQIMLFKQQRMLLMADALLGEISGEWTMESRIPLASDIHFDPQPKNAEGMLVMSGSKRCLVVPMYLPEWRSSPKSGSIAADEDDLLVTNDSFGRSRMYSPVIISLCDKHAKRPYTWRKLTVGEDLRVVGQDEAAAYRLQLNKEQFLFYRTLAPALRRTALGLHTLSDFYVGTFDADLGSPEALIEVDQSAKEEA